MNFVERHLVSLIYLGVLVVAFSFLLWGQEKIHTAQVSGCERGNVIRGQLNTVGATLSQFLLIAAAGRDASSDAAKAAGDDAKAKADANLADQYRALVPTLSQVPLTNCDNI